MKEDKTEVKSYFISDSDLIQVDKTNNNEFNLLFLGETSYGLRITLSKESYNHLFVKMKRLRYSVNISQRKRDEKGRLIKNDTEQNLVQGST